MRKIILFFSAVLMISAIYTITAKASNENNDGAGNAEITDPVNRCRCKHDGCYGGNAISFRKLCARDEGIILCSSFDAVCL